jgi:hypothetical protein
MFTSNLSLSRVERAICMFFAAIIVVAGLSAGAVGAHAAERDARAAIATLAA